MHLKIFKILRIPEIVKIPFSKDKESEENQIIEKYLCEYANVFVKVLSEMVQRQKILISKQEFKEFESSVLLKMRLATTKKKLSKLFLELNEKKLSFEQYLRFTFLFFSNHYCTQYKYFTNTRILNKNIREAIHYLIETYDSELIKELNHFFGVYDNYFGCHYANINSDCSKKLVNVVAHLNYAEDYAQNNIRKYLDLWKAYVEKHHAFGDVLQKIATTYSYIISPKFIPQEQVLKAMVKKEKDQIEKPKKNPETIKELKEYFGFNAEVKYNNSGFGNAFEFPRKFILHKDHKVSNITMIYPDGAYKIGEKYFSSMSDASRIFPLRMA